MVQVDPLDIRHLCVPQELSQLIEHFVFCSADCRDGHDTIVGQQKNVMHTNLIVFIKELPNSRSM